MKKYSISLIFILIYGTLFSQNMNDALRYSQQYNEGTARSVAMGNAFTALGGDLGAININPASIGVYRYSEFTFTPAITSAKSNIDYLGTNTSDNKSRFGIANFGFVTTFNTGRRHSGLINWNIGVAYNKDNNYTNIISARGRTANSSWLSSLASKTNGIYAPDMDINDSYDPYYNFSSGDWRSVLAWNCSLLDTLPGTNSEYIAATENLNGKDIFIGGELDEKYHSNITGNTAVTTLNFGGNISNKLFFGINMNIHSVWYKIDESYSENAINSTNFMKGFNSFTHRYSLKTSGSGFSMKAGLIYVPVKWLRLGTSIATPTWLYLYEEWQEEMSSSFNDGYSQRLQSPLGSYEYRVNTPFRWNLGIAGTIGKFGAVSFDYERANYSQITMHDSDDAFKFSDENTNIENTLGASNTFRVGMEFNPTEFFAIRAGYQNISSPYKNNDIKRQIGSLGVGFLGKSGFFADVAYQQLLGNNNDTFTLYDSVGSQVAPIGINKNNLWKLLITVGFRF